MPIRQFPTNEGEISAFLENFASGLREFQTQLGLSNEDVEAAERDSEVYRYLTAYSFQLETSRRAFYAYKRDILSGKPGRTPAPPIMPQIELPATPVTGIIPRTRSENLLIKKLQGFTSTIGATLGMFTGTAWRPDPDDVVPTIKVTPEADGYVRIRASKHRMDAIRIDYAEGFDQPWQMLGMYTHASIFDQVPNAVPGRPRQILLRARLYCRNQPVGEFSQTSAVVVSA